MGVVLQNYGLYRAFFRSCAARLLRTEPTAIHRVARKTPCFVTAKWRCLPFLASRFRLQARPFLGYSLEQFARRLVVRVLRHQLTAHRQFENQAAQFPDVVGRAGNEVEVFGQAGGHAANSSSSTMCPRCAALPW